VFRGKEGTVRIKAGGINFLKKGEVRVVGACSGGKWGRMDSESIAGPQRNSMFEQVVSTSPMGGQKDYVLNRDVKEACLLNRKRREGGRELKPICTGGTESYRKCKKGFMVLPDKKSEKTNKQSA